ncbi:MAG: hypothetical protein AB7E09_00620 [Candidatus Izemoplasmatales bacterium]
MKQVKTWITNHARPLEQALYDFFFENGTKEDVVKALKKFQNQDGGFGNALEPDYRNPESNPIACQFAANIIHAMNLPKDHEMITLLLEYLKHTPYKKEGKFYFRIPSNNEYPHAPWWHYEKGNEIEGYNPTASLIGFMFYYMDESDPYYSKVEKDLDQIIRDFMNQNITEMHELKCFNELYEYVCEGLDCTNLRRKLLEQNMNAIEKDTSKWLSAYVAKPSQVLVSMHSPGIHELMDLFHQELKMTIANRNSEGVFDIAWEWGQYQEEFEIAKKEWMGIIAVKTLRMLKDFKVNINT